MKVFGETDNSCVLSRCSAKGLIATEIIKTVKYDLLIIRIERILPESKDEESNGARLWKRRIFE